MATRTIPIDGLRLLPFGKNIQRITQEFRQDLPLADADISASKPTALRGDRGHTMTGFTRRRIVRNAAGSGILAASGLVGAARAQSARKTFVLVSGAFCGAWIWRRVTDRLEQG